MKTFKEFVAESADVRVKSHEKAITDHESKQEEFEDKYIDGDGKPSHKQAAMAHGVAADAHRKAIAKLHISPVGNKTHESDYQKSAKTANDLSTKANSHK